MKIDIVDPPKLAGWLNVVIKQRERQANQLAEQFGKDSAAAFAVRAEINEVRAVQGAVAQALADAPQRK